MIERLLTAAVITFGLAFSVALTEGPFGLFKRFRQKLKSKTDREWIRNGAECPICMSFWIGVPVAFGVGWFFGSGLFETVILWLFSFGFTSVITSISPE